MIGKQLDIITKRSIYLFIAVASIYVINSLVIRLFYIDDIFFFNTYGGKFNADEAHKILQLDKSWGFIKFLFIPITLFIRISFVVLCFYIGLYLAEIRVSMRELYKVVIVAEFTFILFTIIRTILVFNHSFTSFEELGGYSPFRFISTVKLNSYPDWIKIPMGILNSIEFLYWLVLSFLLAKLMKWNFLKSLSFVLKTYVLGLLVWILFVVFIVIVVFK
ncbi:MAG: hypothetical protein HOO91_13805 [Bacteroidales bacterium]|nr:hypothetical protein [Bacteroidales bacterium]